MVQVKAPITPNLGAESKPVRVNNSRHSSAINPSILQVKQFFYGAKLAEFG